MSNTVMADMGKVIHQLHTENQLLEKRIKSLYEKRRFEAAVAVLQGWAAGKQTMPVLSDDIAAEQAIQAYYAVMQADALLRELEK